MFETDKMSEARSISVMKYEKGKDSIQFGPLDRAREQTGVRKTASIHIVMDRPTARQ
jgi:hypothetical protein